MNRFGFFGSFAPTNPTARRPTQTRSANDSQARSIQTSEEAAIKIADGTKNPSPPWQIPFADWTERYAGRFVDVKSEIGS